MKRLLTIVLALCLWTSPTEAAFSYYRAVTLNHLKAGSSNSTDFPVMFRSPVSVVSTVGTAVSWGSGDTFPAWLDSVMINGTVYAVSSVTTSIALVLTSSAGTQSSVALSGTPYLATTGNGGQVQSASGFDVGWYTSSDCATGKLNWETVTWTAATGVVEYHFKWTTLSSSTDVPAYLCYGDAGISMDQSNATGVWDSNFVGVYHFGAGLSVADSTGLHNGTNHGATATTTGQIGGAANFVGASSQYIDDGTFTGVGSSDRTVSGWFKCTNLNSVSAFLLGNNTTDVAARLSYFTTSSYFIGAVGGYDFGGTYTDNVWTSVAMTAGGTGHNDIISYKNGAQNGTATSSGAAAANPPFIVGGFGVGLYYTGDLDELRVSNTRRSADWLLQEYNNGFDPFTFWTPGSQTAVAGGTAVSRLPLTGVGK